MEEFESGTYLFINDDGDGVISSKEFKDPVFLDGVIKEFVYFLLGTGFDNELIEKYIPYFDI